MRARHVVRLWPANCDLFANGATLMLDEARVLADGERTAVISSSMERGFPGDDCRLRRFAAERVRSTPLDVSPIEERDVR
ncbi:MAG: hypothetical protein AAF411_01865 [Myxococcota bacterium]